MIFDETLHKNYAQHFVAEQVVLDEKTEHQHLVLFDHVFFGRVMMLDGVVQTTERDEFIYHEMFAHVPLCAHANPHHVLIIGGGDGGLLREVCRHPDVERITMVEIDGSVIEMSRQYLPHHSQGAFDDQRLELVIMDAAEYLKSQSDDVFDVILSDSTDPIGPGEVLFQSDFYGHMQRVLSPGGIVATQNGVSFLQLDSLRTTAVRMGPHFQHQTFYAAAVPTYIGGNMHYAWGSDDKRYLQVERSHLEKRVAPFRQALRYYHPGLHHAAFCLPRYVELAIAHSELITESKE